VTDNNDHKSLPWRPSHRRALLIVFTTVLIIATVIAARHRQYVPDPLPLRSPLADQLADRIDPNTADIATLAALPSLGERKAAAIVAFREKVQQREPGAVVYRSLDDLLKVRGIGVAMVANLKPYLTLSDEPTTTPSTHGNK
jgi:endonuclease III